MSAEANLNPLAIRSHNFRNAIHTFVLVSGTGLLAGAIAYMVFGVDGLVWATGFGAVGIYMLSQVSPKVVLSLYKARPLAAHELPELHAVIDELAVNAGLPAKPGLYYVPSKMMNAFAVGRREDSAIAITDGLAPRHDAAPAEGHPGA